MKFDFNSIPKFCISLRRSEERRNLVSKEFKKHNLSVSFFDAVDKHELQLPELSVKISGPHMPPTGSGVLACMLSHVQLLRKAKELKLPAICIFEDDVKLCDDFTDRIKYIETLQLDFDFFALGGHFSTPQENGNSTPYKNIRRFDSLGGTYAYIITEKVYDFVLRNITYNFGMDEFYSTHTYKRFKCLAFVPFLAGCVPCKSEITDTHWEYENIKWAYWQEHFFVHPEDYKSKEIKKPQVQEEKVEEKTDTHLNNPKLNFTKKNHLKYLQLMGHDKRIYDDITLFTMHKNGKFTPHELASKMMTYNVPFQVKEEKKKIYIEMETFRIPEIGFLNE